VTDDGDPHPQIMAGVVRVAEKVYREDVGEDGAYDYRYWDYDLDIDGRRYGARVYRDEPGCAYVAIAPRPVDPEQHGDLRAIAGFFRAEGVELYTLGRSGGYEPVEDAISQKPCPPGLRG
jgi:hypothetical protein